MTEPIQPTGASGPGKPEQANQSDGASDGEGLSFREVLEKARKALDQGEKASEIMEGVSAADRTELEKVLSQNKRVEDLFEELFEMIEKLKSTQSDFEGASITEGSEDD